MSGNVNGSASLLAFTHRAARLKTYFIIWELYAYCSVYRLSSRARYRQPTGFLIRPSQLVRHACNA